MPLFEELCLESQSHCNRACWFCPRTYDRSGKYLDASGKSVIRAMPTDKILDVMNQARALGFQGLIGFHHYSEPLVDPRNVMLAREARQRGLVPWLHTNGDVLRRNESLCREVSEVYAHIVVGLYDYASDAELEGEKRFWRARLSCARLDFSPIGRDGRLSGSSMGIPRALVPTDARMAVPDLSFPNAPCRRPLIRMIIQWDGAVCNCCEDTSGAFGLGNVYENTLAQLWFSDHHRRVVDDLDRGRRERYALCRSCPLPPSGPAADARPIEMVPRWYGRERRNPSGAAEGSTHITCAQ
jgi:radical SAM protein with 4Fe4S-binding SPASM domain